ncbi:MAG: glutamate synthase-related protein [Chloroflexi bacterium]|nr:glutamate synthase-related protein [Chloroflexota bacterium]MCL5074756.1 glutamate synthase-related protein [Chloroflexota bacterium]
MSGVLENARSTTGTTTRLKDVSPVSGMCPICIKQCAHMCEVGKSAFRGREVLYPSPEEFGQSTQASNKEYFLDWSHFQIQVEVRGAEGIEANPDKAIFPNVDVSSVAGGVPLKVPLIICALGSTDVAKRNWDGLAMGAALSGVIQAIGENVCGMDPEARFNSDGKVTYSKDLSYRVNKFRQYWDGRHGDIAVQTNVEDTRFGVDLYALKELGVNIIERKWGQGAKAIGGEVRVNSLERALMLKGRGYIVLPDPEDETVQEAFRKGAFRTFERHSRVGMPEERSFVEDIAWLRAQGAKKVFLKTGAYNAAAVAFTLKCASLAKIDLVTFDGAGGGTGMSPVPMMNECSTPTVYLLAQVLDCIRLLKKKGRFIPDIAIAGGFVNEAQIFKAIAMSNLGDGHGPYVKAIGMSRAPLLAVMKSEYFTELAAQGKLPRSFADLYGSSPEQFFISASDLRSISGDGLGKTIPWSAVGLYTYFIERIGIGLKQLLAGARKWRLDLLDRSDIVALTEWASQVTGIPTVQEADRDAMETILDF